MLVLDSFAILAFLMREPGGPLVDEFLRDALLGRRALHMTVINLGEVFYRTRRLHDEARAQGALQRVMALPITLHEADMTLTLEAASIKGQYPLSYADCFAAALAMRLDAAVVTGDPEFRQVEHLVPIVWLPR